MTPNEVDVQRRYYAKTACHYNEVHVYHSDVERAFALIVKPLRIDGAWSAHNGYLALLCEVGVVGARPIACSVFSGSAQLFRRAVAGEKLAEIGAALVAGYLFAAVFERFIVNSGNPTSILVLIFLLAPKAQGLVRQSRMLRSIGGRDALLSGGLRSFAGDG